MTFKIVTILGSDAYGRKLNLLSNAKIMYSTKACDVHSNEDKNFDIALQEAFKKCHYDLDNVDNYVIDNLNGGCTYILDSLADYIYAISDCNPSVNLSIAIAANQVMLLLSMDGIDKITFVIRNCNQQQVDAMKHLLWINNHYNTFKHRLDKIDSNLGELNERLCFLAEIINDKDWSEYTQYALDYPRWLAITYYLILTKGGRK